MFIYQRQKINHIQILFYLLSGWQNHRITLYGNFIILSGWQKVKQNLNMVYLLSSVNKQIQILIMFLVISRCQKHSHNLFISWGSIQIPSGGQKLICLRCNSHRNLLYNWLRYIINPDCKSLIGERRMAEYCLCLCSASWASLTSLGDRWQVSHGHSRPRWI